MLRCRERRPSEGRLKLWAEIEARLPELEVTAIAAVPDPPPSRWSTGFERGTLTLDEIVIEGDDTFEFFLHTPIGDKLDMWPIATFVGWVVRDAEWAT